MELIKNLGKLIILLCLSYYGYQLVFEKPFRIDARNRLMNYVDTLFPNNTQVFHYEQSNRTRWTKRSAGKKVDSLTVTKNISS